MRAFHARSTAAVLTATMISIGIVALGATSASAATGTIKAASGRCLDVPGNTQVNNTQVNLWDCAGNANQTWTTTSSKQLQVYGSKCLDAEGGATAAGTRAVITSCTGATSQQWNVNSSGTITNAGSGLCLDVYGRGTANGSLIIVWTCTGASNQQWSVAGGGSTGGGSNHPNTTYPVTREGAYGNGRYTIYRPSNPAAVDRTMPVVVFGNSACEHRNNDYVRKAVTALASRGYVVVDEGSVNGASVGVANGSPLPYLLTDGISWAEKENGRSGAALRGRIDLSRVVVAGHSCGGLEALVAGADSRVKTVVSMDSGFFVDGAFGYPRSELNKLHTPVLYLDGGTTDIAYDNTRANYDLTRVAAVRASQSQAGHAGFFENTALINDGMYTVAQFLEFTLYGNQTARSYFLGSNPGLASKANWTVQSKNF